MSSYLLSPLMSIEFVSHCPVVLQASASSSMILSTDIVPILTVSSETDLWVRLLVSLDNNVNQLTGNLQIAIGIEIVSLCNIERIGRNGCKGDGKGRKIFIKHDGYIVLFEVGESEGDTKS